MARDALYSDLLQGGDADTTGCKRRLQCAVATQNPATSKDLEARIPAHGPGNFFYFCFAGVNKNNFIPGNRLGWELILEGFHLPQEQNPPFPGSMAMCQA